MAPYEILLMLDPELPDERQIEIVSRTRELLALLADAGWSGTVDVEIFGVPDDPESFWALPVDEAARRAYEAAIAVLP
mgnify:CR=1 FL=1